MGKLTTFQKEKIVEDYLECENVSEVARMNSISRTTVKNILDGDAELDKKMQRKKEQNTLEMLQYMDARKQKAQDLIDHFLDELAKPEYLLKANAQQIATVLGILLDKFVFNTERTLNENRKLELQILKLESELKGNDTPPIDNSLITALNSTATEVWEEGNAESDET